MDSRQLARFMARIEISEEGCWEWRAYRKPNGYGQFYVHTSRRSPGGRRPSYAHRVAYEHFVGPIPQGLEIDHLCRNRGCANPDHLEAVTRSVNMRRGETTSGANARKTHCPKGHPYDGVNNRGERICKRCKYEKHADWRRRSRAMRAAAPDADPRAGAASDSRRCSS